MEKICLGKDGCSGCSACALICPRNAIQMEFNENGEYAPAIDETKCVKCRLCERICTVKNPGAPQISQTETYVAVAKNKDILTKSSSGGVAQVFARKAVEMGMPVCGVWYDADKESATHIVLRSHNELGKIQGSKYLPSANMEGFREIIGIKKGLVVGTPCQIAGLDAVLRKEGIRDNYFLVDIFCHGVPLKLVWEQHLAWLKKKRKINDYTEAVFRQGKDYRMKLGAYEAWINQDAFYTFFISGLAHNRQCYSCKYRRNSCADIRLGDLALEKYSRLPYSPSVIIANSEKGMQLLNECADELQIYEESYALIDAIQKKGNEEMPADYETMIQRLRGGEYPENLIRHKMWVGRIKAFIKHRILSKFLSNGNIESLDEVAKKHGQQPIELGRN